jgi:hypothetical protein
MSKLKADILRALTRAGLIVLLAGGSELVSQGIKYYTNHDASSFMDKAVIMAGLGYLQKFLSAQLITEESTI